MQDYILKHNPADFLVDEVMCLPVSRSTSPKRYHYYTLRKKNFSTFEATNEIAKFFKIDPHEIGFAGLKDEYAITFQHISSPIKFDIEKLRLLNNQYSDNDKQWIILNYYGSDDAPIKVANLLGNAFTINIRNLPLFELNTLPNRLTLHYINYYGGQRFGLPDQIKNTHLIGKYFLKKDYGLAISELAKQNSDAGCQAQLWTGDSEKFFPLINQNLLGLFQSAYFSHVWNSHIYQYITALGLAYQMRDCEGIEIPLPKQQKDIIRLAQHRQMLTNTRVTHQADSFIQTHYLRPTVVQTQVHIQKIAEDECHPGKQKMQIKFYSPLGSYATVAIAHFICQLSHFATLEARAMQCC